MDKNDKQKVKKYWRNKLMLVIGVISSLGFFSFGAKEGLHTLRKDTVPQNILLIKRQLEPLSQNLHISLDRNSERTIEIYKQSIIEYKQFLDEYKRSLRRYYQQSLAGTTEKYERSFEEYKQSLAKYEQSLEKYEQSLVKYEQSLEKYEQSLAKYEQSLEEYEQSLANQKRSLISSLWILVNPWKKDYKKSLSMSEKALDASKRYLDESNQYSKKRERSLRESEYNFERSFRYILEDFELFLEQSLAYRGRSIERDFFKKIVRIKFYLFLLEERTLSEKHSEHVSKSLLKELNQTLEMLNNLGLTENKEILTTEQKQTKLIQFSILAILSVTGLIFSLLLLIRQQKQDITWNLTGMYLLPEECVDVLEAKYIQLQSQNKSTRAIRLIMLWNIFTLLKGLYTEVFIQNLFLSSKNKRD